MTAPNASRNLLFGVLAVQMGFCRSDQLVNAMNDWLRERSLSLDEILVKLGILTSRRRELLVQAVDEHLVLHGPVSELSVEAVQTGAQQRGPGDAAVPGGRRTPLGGAFRGVAKRVGRDGTSPRRISSGLGS